MNLWSKRRAIILCYTCTLHCYRIVHTLSPCDFFFFVSLYISSGPLKCYLQILSTVEPFPSNPWREYSFQGKYLEAKYGKILHDQKTDIRGDYLQLKYCFCFPLLVIFQPFCSITQIFGGEKWKSLLVFDSVSESFFTMFMVSFSKLTWLA